MLSKSLQTLKRVFLEDWSSRERARIIHMESAKDNRYFDLYTQSAMQRNEGIAMRFRIFAEETPVPTAKGRE